MCMTPYPNIVMERLSSIIDELSQSPELYVNKPGVDFTRDRKLPFESVMQLLISMGGNSIYNELLTARGYDVNTATSSAFVQQRAKILSCAFEYLLHEFTGTHSDLRTYRGYRLLANDGSSLHIPTNPADVDTYFENKAGEKGYNLLHLNAMYDLCNRIYVDALVQPGRLLNEKRALTDMVDRSRIDEKVILIADRSYESYNIFAHIEEKGWKYLIRVKDVDSNGILSGLKLPRTDEFDVAITRILTRRNTNAIKAQPDVYKHISTNTTFDYIESSSSDTYTISFRVVRFKISDDTYETIITNLDPFAFPPAELKKLYHMRWGIETSFRELKYTVGLINFHSKIRESIVQEVFARIIMYNFAEMITTHVVISKSGAKHVHQVNFTVAIHVCRQFMRVCFWNHGHLPDVEALIAKNTLPVRPDRSNKRKMRSQTVVSFLYRVA